MPLVPVTEPFSRGCVNPKLPDCKSSEETPPCLKKLYALRFAEMEELKGIRQKPACVGSLGSIICQTSSFGIIIHGRNLEPPPHSPCAIAIL